MAYWNGRFSPLSSEVYSIIVRRTEERLRQTRVSDLLGHYSHAEISTAKTLLASCADGGYRLPSTAWSIKVGEAYKLALKMFRKEHRLYQKNPAIYLC